MLSNNDITKISHPGIESSTNGLVGTSENEEIDKYLEKTALRLFYFFVDVGID